MRRAARDGRSSYRRPGCACAARAAGDAERVLGCRRRRGFTILELLTTFAIITTLAGLILPAVSSAREAARRLQCTNQLKQIGLALHFYHEQYHCLPCGWQWEASGQSAYGWAVPLLPYFEHHAVFRQVDRNARLENPVNAAARTTSIAALVCPSDITEPTFPLYENTETAAIATPLVELPTASYVGVYGTVEPDDQIPAPPGDGTFIESRPVQFSELVRGLSHTIIVGERTMARVPSTWLGVDFRGEDAACRLVGSAITSPNCETCDECEFGSRHPGAANFLRADGSVRLTSENIDSMEYRKSARREDL
ncbi:MAG: DUF1559 domain-containing protein [Planctomycetaceae bacterium]